MIFLELAKILVSFSFIRSYEHLAMENYMCFKQLLKNNYDWKTSMVNGVLSKLQERTIMYSEMGIRISKNKTK